MTADPEIQRVRQVLKDHGFKVEHRTDEDVVQLTQDMKYVVASIAAQFALATTLMTEAFNSTTHDFETYSELAAYAEEWAEAQDAKD